MSEAVSAPVMSMWRRAALVAGGAVLIVVGSVLLVLPGPGWATIAAGLYLWSKVFPWADRLLTYAKQRAQSLRMRRPPTAGGTQM